MSPIPHLSPVASTFPPAGRHPRLLMAVFLTLLTGCGPIPSPPPDARPTDPAPEAVDDALEPADAAIARFATLVNARREREGCAPLAWDPAVARVAAAHSRDMVERGYFGHVSPGGADPFDRLRAAGIGYAAAAENVAYGQPTGDGVFAQWMASRGHRENMLNCEYTHHGVGHQDSHWTQLLLRPSR